MKRLLAGTVLAACSILVYGRGLAVLPVRADERQLGTEASLLLARTPRALFVRVEGDAWLAPLPVYTTAALVRLVPSAPTPARWAALVYGVADVVLLYALVVVCVGRIDIGLAAGVALLFTPAHAFFSRTAAAEGIWPLPFILMWALCVAVEMQRPAAPPRWILVGGTVSLLLSALAQVSAVLMIPVFGALSVVMCRPMEGWRKRSGLLAVAIVVVVLLVWCLLAFRSGDGAVPYRWVLQRAHIGDPGTSFRLVVWQRAATITGWFWNFFLPSHLFLSPAEPGFCGLFLSATAVPIVAGVFMFRGNGGADVVDFGAMRPIIGAAWMTGPLSAAVASHPPLDGRALIVVPFGILLAIQSSLGLWRRGGFIGRIVLAAAFVGAASQGIACFR